MGQSLVGYVGPSQMEPDQVFHLLQEAQLPVEGRGLGSSGLGRFKLAQPVMVAAQVEIDLEAPSFWAIFMTVPPSWSTFWTIAESGPSSSWAVADPIIAKEIQTAMVMLRMETFLS